jgi:magnesium transporter
VIRCVEVSDEGRTQTPCELDGRRSHHGDGFVWIDLDQPSEDDLRQLHPVVELHDLAVEDAIEAGQRPKIERYDDGVAFVALNSPQYPIDTNELGFSETHIVVGDDYVITISHDGTGLIDRIHARSGHEPLADPTEVLHAIVDGVADDYIKALDQLDVEIRSVERNVFVPAEVCDVAPRIYALKRDVLELLHNSEPLLSSVQRLISDLERASDDLAPYFRDVADHLGLAVSRLERMRDLLTDALDANLARLSVRQNDDMRRMSAWAALFLLPTVLVGIWGMNFEHMPELDEPWGYPAALGGIVGSCALLYWRLRRSGWL